MVLKVFSSPSGASVLCRGFCSMGIAQCAWERRHKARHPSRGGQSSGSKLLQTPPCLRQQPPAAPALSRLIQVKPRLQNASLKEILREGTWNEKSAAGLGFVHTQTKTVFFLVGFLNSKHRFVQEKPKPWCRDCSASPAVRAGLLRSEPR